ncbi:MAG: hypothetical protein JSV69_11445, partial [Chloroflexota bacterium]
ERQYSRTLYSKESKSEIIIIRINLCNFPNADCIAKLIPSIYVQLCYFPGFAFFTTCLLSFAYLYSHSHDAILFSGLLPPFGQAITSPALSNPVAQAQSRQYPAPYHLPHYQTPPQ